MTVSEASHDVLTDLRMELDDAERAEVLALAVRLVRFPPQLLDDQDWVAEARRLSCHLPVRLLEVIRRYRNDPGQDGTLSIAHLPVDGNGLPPTPGVRDSVERSATVPTAVVMLIGQQLGEVIAYRQEKRGALVQNVVPVRSLEVSQSNAGSVPLELHNENAFHPHSPHYVGLLCLRPDHEGRAGTLVSSIRRTLPLLSREDVEILRQGRFMTEAPPSFDSPERTTPHPVLAGCAEDPDILVDFNATAPLDEGAKQALERLRQALLEAAGSLVLRPGELVFVDNRLVVHGRSDFVPRYDGNDRWLHRVFVHLDNRRSRSHRSANGSVLT